jgi:hypothetical protein
MSDIVAVTHTLAKTLEKIGVVAGSAKAVVFPIDSGAIC